MRIALFGGSFNPPHRGHVAIARAAADALRLDRVLFAPVGRQPLKQAFAAAAFADRLAMTALACRQDPRFAPSQIDAPTPDGRPNYTVDTLAQLALDYPGDQRFILVGADSFRELPRWHEPQRLLELAVWIVMSRPGVTLAQDAGMAELTAGHRGRIHYLDSVHEDVSATALRQRLEAGEPCEDLLPPGVPQYIRQHHLYLRSGSDADSHAAPGR